MSVLKKRKILLVERPDENNLKLNFTRKSRISICKSFCDYNSIVCPYYEHKAKLCWLTFMRYKNTKSDLFHVCSILNMEKSSFIYALEKII